MAHTLRVFTSLSRQLRQRLGCRAGLMTAHSRSLSTNSGSGSDSDSFGVYTGGKVVPFKRDMEFINPGSQPTFPAFRVMDAEGELIPGGAGDPKIEKQECLKIYRVMVRLNNMDKVLYEAQRHGRISFYMQNHGEEACTIGSAAGLQPGDMIYGQYREAGALMYRGFTLQQFADQCFSNTGDPARGRQMPVHYGSAELNFQTISSPLTTQVPQAAGAAYAFKQAGEDRIVCVYFGDGAASEGDFHAGLNFAATLKAPCLFFCRNNGYAISTPVTEQYAGDGILPRGVAYGMPSLRIDGNDVLAVIQATKEARRRCFEEQTPVLIEAMTYRVGHHSTSDDSTRYRENEEIKEWSQHRNPVTRFRQYLEKKGWWDEDLEVAAQQEEREGIMSALLEAESKEHAHCNDLFADVYDELTPNLERQWKELQDHMAKYPDHYAGGH